MSSFQPGVCASSELTEFFAELTEFAAELSEETGRIRFQSTVSNTELSVFFVALSEFGGRTQ